MANVTFEELMRSFGELRQKQDKGNYKKRLGFVLVAPSISEYVGENQRAVDMFLDFMADCEVLEKKQYNKEYLRYLIRHEELEPVEDIMEPLPYYTVNFYPSGEYSFQKTKHRSKSSATAQTV